MHLNHNQVNRICTKKSIDLFICLSLAHSPLPIASTDSTDFMMKTGRVTDRAPTFFSFCFLSSLSPITYHLLPITHYLDSPIFPIASSPLSIAYSLPTNYYLLSTNYFLPYNLSPITYNLALRAPHPAIKAPTTTPTQFATKSITLNAL